MAENKWVNGGIAVAVAGALTGLAVWMSSGPPPEQAPRGDGPVQADEIAPADRAGSPSPPKGRDETEAAPADMGSFPAGGTTKGRAGDETEAAPADAGSLPGPPTKG